MNFRDIVKQTLHDPWGRGIAEDVIDMMTAKVCEIYSKGVAHGEAYGLIQCARMLRESDLACGMELTRTPREVVEQWANELETRAKTIREKRG